MGERGQAWSMDLVIGVLIFLLAIGIIYALLMNRSKEDITPLRIESEVIASKLANDPALKVTDNNQLDAQKLSTLTTLDYETLKQQFGVKDDFCIYLQDENGQLAFISDNTTGNMYAGIGAGTADLNLTCMMCDKTAIQDGIGSVAWDSSPLGQFCKFATLDKPCSIPCGVPFNNTICTKTACS